MEIKYKDNCTKYLGIYSTLSCGDLFIFDGDESKEVYIRSDSGITIHCTDGTRSEKNMYYAVSLKSGKRIIPKDDALVRLIHGTLICSTPTEEYMSAINHTAYVAWHTNK